MIATLDKIEQTKRQAVEDGLDALDALTVAQRTGDRERAEIARKQIQLAREIYFSFGPETDEPG